MAASVQGSALQAQINALGERMEKEFGDVKNMIRGFDERVRSLETREAGCQPILTERIDAAWRKIGEHDKVLEEVQRAVVELAHTNAILKWLLGVVTSVLAALLIATATGALRLVLVK